MQQAILTGNVVRLEYLLSQGYPVNKAENEFGLVWEPNYNVYQLLNGDIYYANPFGANAKYGDNISWTPLQYAAILGNDKIVETLLTKSDPNIRDAAGQTAKDIAQRRSHQSTVEIISQSMEKILPVVDYSRQEVPSGEFQGEILFLRTENNTIKNENSTLKQNSVRLITEREALSAENETLKGFVINPHLQLKNPVKLQELINFGVPLNGVCILVDTFNAIDKNSARNLGAVVTLADLASRVDKLMMFDKIDLVEADRLYQGLSDTLAKWKSDEFQCLELDREMMTLSDKLILAEKIDYLKKNQDVLLKHVFEQYQLSKTSTKARSFVLYQCLDRFSKSGDEALLREVIRDFVDPWITGKLDSEMDAICDLYRLDIKQVLKGFKARFQLPQLLPEWSKRTVFLETVMNGKHVSKSLSLTSDGNK